MPDCHIPTKQSTLFLEIRIKSMPSMLINFWLKYGLWGMGGSPDFPANQVGGAQNPWVITDYGLSQLWVRTALTVCISIYYVIHTVI
jgi:hypothetical protein